MSDLPAPLVPAEVDLRDFKFMPLDVLRLRDSDLAGLATGEEFKAAVLLWCAAWHQVPAGSLPDDDRLLARYSDARSAWPKVRDMALHGFIKCADGRLYHPVIAEKAHEAWAKRNTASRKGRAGAAARWSARNDIPDNASATTNACPSHQSGIAQAVPQPSKEKPGPVPGDGKGQGQGQGHIPPLLIPPVDDRHQQPAMLKRQRRKAPVRVAPGTFELSDDHYAYAKAKGLDDDATMAETEKFLTHHGAKGSMFSDWDKAWQNWIIKAVEIRSGRRA